MPCRYRAGFRFAGDGEARGIDETAFRGDGHGPPPGRLRFCRRMWEALIDDEAGAAGAVHEARWLNLLGFGLRPGYGLAVDDWRVAETWRLVQGKLVHPSAARDWKAGFSGGGLAAGFCRSAAGPGRTASAIRGPASAGCRRQGTRRRFWFPAPRNGGDLASARLAGVAPRFA